MKKHMTKLAVVLLLATSGAVHAMPILDIQGGQLFGRGLMLAAPYTM